MPDSLKLFVPARLYLDNINHLLVLEDSDSEEDSEASSAAGWSDDNSVHAALGFRPEADESDGETVEGGPAVSLTPITVSEAATPFLECEKTACINDGGNIQKLVGPEEALDGINPNMRVLHSNGPGGSSHIALPLGSDKVGPSGPSINSHNHIPHNPEQATSCATPEIAMGNLIQNPANSPPNHNMETPSQRKELARKSKHHKAKKKQQDPKEWKEFVTPMASAEELENNLRRKAQRKLDRKGVNQQLRPSLPSNMVGGLEFGKNLEGVEESIPKRLEAGGATF